MAEIDPIMERREREAQEQKNKSLKNIMWALVAVAALMAAGLAYVWATKSSLVKDLNAEKEDLTQQMIALRGDYESLSSDYESVNSQLDSSREEVNQLIERIQKTEATNRAKMRQYEKELENAELKGQVENLSGQVAAGSVIKSRGLSVAAYNSSDKVTDRSSRVVRLLASLSLVENELAPKGPVRVYLRVKDPEGILLTNSNQTSFSYNGQTMVASASREVDYQGKEVDLSIYLNDIPSYQAGIYTVEAYTAQAFLGKTELLLR